MNPKLLVWDWNGTLLDDMELTYEIENIMLCERGMTQIPSRDFYLSHFGFPIIDYYVKLGYDFNMYPYDELAKEFHQLYSNSYRRCALRENSVNTLATIMSMGIPQIILSASNQERLIEQVDHYAVSKYFEELLGLPDDYAYSKVQRAISFISNRKINPEDVLFIGDTDHDYKVAKEIGGECILLTGGHQGRDVLTKCHVPVFESLNEVLDYIHFS